jgi:hypothetical protein
MCHDIVLIKGIEKKFCHYKDSVKMSYNFGIIGFLNKILKILSVEWCLIMKAIRINQLPDCVARWQHGSQICFATFIDEKSQNC